MNDIAIHVENLSKQYKIGALKRRHDTLRDHLTQAVKSLFSRNGQSSTLNPQPANHIWALKDVSFDVKLGEVLGIIGRNGSGKSTLLKILSRITEPTMGNAAIYGRVSSLLEVGTGFHPELTGRENVYFNGVMLGMDRLEIARKFDEIVEFSSVEKFIDTPIKHYSSGMKVRLAFSVAAHLEPEILVVDEVLAVGDIQFQKKCIGKMKEVGKLGRTVLFVSHQMNQIRRLTERIIWLDDGQIRKIGPTGEVVGDYEIAMTSGALDTSERPASSKSKARFQRWEIVEPRSDQSNLLTTLGPVTIKFEFRLKEPVRMGHHGISLFNSEGQLMWAWATDNLKLDGGSHGFYYTFPMLPLRPGIYRWHLSLYDEHGLLDECYFVPEMNIVTEIHQHAMDQWQGILNVPCDFTIDRSI